jgi:16S rRNA (guanine966-N2)-methyltransferase
MKSREAGCAPLLTTIPNQSTGVTTDLMAKRKPKRGEINETSELRIIGGKLRGSKLRYEIFQQGGDPVTRPMKHRVREAIFNLISTESEGKHAIDLFAGTGALGLEALSRGSLSATFIEKHVPTARIIEENIKTLGLSDRAQLLTTSAFLWGKRDLPKWKVEMGKGKESDISPFPFPISPLNIPWLTFCSPPYAFYHERQQDMLELITAILETSPEGSIMVIEADEAFNFELLPGNIAERRREEGWQIRTYFPAVVGIWRK